MFWSKKATSRKEAISLIENEIDALRVKRRESDNGEGNQSSEHIEIESVRIDTLIAEKTALCLLLAEDRASPPLSVKRMQEKIEVQGLLSGLLIDSEKSSDEDPSIKVHPSISLAAAEPWFLGIMK